MVPITAQTFEPEHFDKLIRGLTIAKAAFEHLTGEVELATEREDRLREDALKWETAAQEGVTLNQWNALVECIHDCKRGIRTLDEVMDYALVGAWQHPE